VNRLILAAALATTIGLPVIASADTMAPGAGPVVCHAVKSGETANATMGTTQLACTTVDMAKVHSAMDTMHTVMMKQQATPDQMKQMQSAMTTLQTLLQLNVAGGTENANKG
jgi:hypothetical protein